MKNEKELMSEVISFRTTPVVMESLSQEAANRGWSVSHLVDFVLREYLFNLRN